MTKLINIIWSDICILNEKFSHISKLPERKYDNKMILLTIEKADKHNCNKFSKYCGNRHEEDFKK